MLYGPGSKDLVEQVWVETLDEFSFVDASDMLKSHGMLA
jgi:hypothetical protein